MVIGRGAAVEGSRGMRVPDQSHGKGYRLGNVPHVHLHVGMSSAVNCRRTPLLVKTTGTVITKSSPDDRIENFPVGLQVPCLWQVDAKRGSDAHLSCHFDLATKNLNILLA